MVTDYSYSIQVRLGATAWVNPAFVNTSFIGSGLTSGWVDLSNDVIKRYFVMLTYGIAGTTPVDRTASAGSVVFTLNNGKKNSANTQGYYSPFNSSKRSGFDFNIPVRVVLTYGGITTYKFYGSLAEIFPTVEEMPVTHCKAFDIFDDYATTDEPELPIQFSKTGDQILTTILDALVKQPPFRSFETGVETFPIALDGGTGQIMKVRERIDQLCTSEFGYCYPVGDLVGGGTLRWENRHHRAINTTIKFTLDDADVLLGAGFMMQGAKSQFYRTVQATGHPINDPELEALTDLFVLGNTSTILAPGETNDSITGLYTDSSKNAIGGTDFTPPELNTDFNLNTLPDGTGTDLTPLCTITSVCSAGSVRFIITNNSTSAGNIIKLKQRGRPVIRNTVLITAEVAGSYGDQILTFDMPFQSDVNIVTDVANYLASTQAIPFPNLPPIRFWANRDSAHLHAAFELEPGDRIAVSETINGLIAREYTINSVTIEFDEENKVWCTWGLEAASSQRYWLMGTVGSGEMGVTTFFGF